VSTTYRAVVHCDPQRSAACAGLFEIATGPGGWAHVLDRLGPALEAAGWVRGYRGDGSGQTFDECPACRVMEPRQRDRAPQELPKWERAP
jgi:hypothetical protein